MIVTECPEKFVISFQKYFHEELSNSKVAKIVAETLDFIKTIVEFPLRYFGSKSWSLPGIIFRTPIALFKRIIGIQQNRSLCQEIFGSGYQHQPTKLTIEGTKKYIRTVTVATAAHNLSVKWRTAIAAFGLNVLSPVDVFCEDLKRGELKNIDVDKNRFFDSNSGLKAILVSNCEEVFISFAALGGARVEIVDKKECEALEKNIWKKVVYANHAGLTPKIYQQAEKLFLAIKDHPQISGKRINLVGHCMGGSLAAYIALRHRVNAVSFNTLAHGAGIQQQIGTRALSEAHKYVTHISIENDFFSDFKAFSFFDRFANFIGLKTPGNFGKHYRIPVAQCYIEKKSYKERQDAIHNFVMGSMMGYIGKNTRCLPQDLKLANEDMTQYC